MTTGENEMTEPTSDQCSRRAEVRGPRGERAVALWYPQMGGYVGRCVAVPREAREDGSCCFDVHVWHDGEFPFGDGRGPATLHHCDPGQFVRFGREVAAFARPAEPATAMEYVAEPDPSSVVSVPYAQPWRVRARTAGARHGLPWTIGQGMTEAEARACERALCELPGAEPVDEVARRRTEATSVSVVSSVTVSEDGRTHDLAFERPSGRASSAPFVPYSAEDVAEVAKAAGWFLERKLAPSAALTESLARAVLTMARQLAAAKPTASEPGDRVAESFARVGLPLDTWWRVRPPGEPRDPLFEASEGLHARTTYEEGDGGHHVTWSAEGRPGAMIAVYERASVALAVHRAGGSAEAPGRHAGPILMLPLPAPDRRRLIKRIEFVILFAD